MARKEQAEQECLDRTARTGQPEHESQDRQERDRQNRKGRTEGKDIKGQVKQDRYTRQAKQDIARTGQTET